MDEGEHGTGEHAQSAGALHEGFMALDAQFHFAQAAGLPIAQEQVHLNLEGGEIGEDLSLEVSRCSVLPHSG